MLDLVFYMYHLALSLCTVLVNQSVLIATILFPFKADFFFCVLKFTVNKLVYSVVLLSSNLVLRVAFWSLGVLKVSFSRGDVTENHLYVESWWLREPKGTKGI